MQFRCELVYFSSESLLHSLQFLAHSQFETREPPLHQGVASPSILENRDQVERPEHRYPPEFTVRI